VSVLESYELMCSLIAYATDAVLAKSGYSLLPLPLPLALALALPLPLLPFYVLFLLNAY
jgi:hypothetical protein